MKKRTCNECGKELNRAGCIRKEDGTLIHGGKCGGEVKEDLIPDAFSRIRREKRAKKS